MAQLEIRRYPSRILSKTALEVRRIDGRTAKLLNDMVDTMYVAGGIGLAAPQVGLLTRAIVVDIDIESRGRRLIKLLNPEIVEQSGSIVWEEGCLSVVNYTAEVTRSRHVLVRGWTIEQKQVEIEASDLEAVCLQHEIDHLEGILFIDHISRLRREYYRRRLARDDATAPAASASGSAESL